jgi:zinc transport system permease protein
MARIAAMTDLVSDYDWLLRAWLAACLLAIMAGPAGCLVVWRRMAFFGDTLAHGALLGVGLGLLAGVAPIIGVLAGGTALAWLLTLAQRQTHIARDNWLGIFSHSMLAGGLVLYSLSGTSSYGLMGFLMGDVLAVGWADVALSAVLACVALAVVLKLCWKPLVMASIHPGIAMADGLKVKQAELLFALTLALVVAVAMQVVGVLLTGALLLLPPAAARFIARSPASMAGWAAGLGVAGVTLGLGASLYLDIPAGPAMVLCHALLLAGVFAKNAGHRG